MNTHSDKTKENKSKAVANNLDTKAAKPHEETAAHNELQEMANSSPQVKQLRAIQAMANITVSQTAQLKENPEEELPEKKQEPIQKKENKTGLPDTLKSGIENLSGYSMDHVKVHYNSDKPAQLQALAYAQGSEIHIGPGQEKHLPHEAWHVVQQKQGRVKPTLQMKEQVNVNDDSGLEQEADVMGAKAIQLRKDPLPTQTPDVIAAATVTQLASDYDGILPAHEIYRDSYAFGPGHGKSTEFTYHHIIPENQLKKVAVELKGIKAYVDALEVRDDNAELRGKGGELDGKVNLLVAGAKAGWVNTRIKNVVYSINTTYDTYGVSVTEEEVRTIITTKAEQVMPLFEAFRDLIKPKTQPAYDRVRNAVGREIVEALKDPAFYGHINSLDEANIRVKLAASINPQFYDINTIMVQVMTELRVLRAEQKNGQLNKGKIRSALEPAINTWSFENYYTTLCPKLHQNATSSDQHLKKIVQQNALPHDDGHLEHAVQWNPGNIHRGPSSSKRLNPDSGIAFDAILDDGGETFEKAAVNLVTSDHFQLLVNLSNAITPFVATKVAEVPPDAAKIDLAKSIVDQMQAIRLKGLTEFKPGNWEKLGDDKMRLKKNQDKVDEATQRGAL